MEAVCAVVVTYYPTPEMMENIARIFDQVKDLVVVDNGSDAGQVEGLRTASRALGYHLIENSENLGIADALNRGVLWVKSQGFPWVILFDQDSRITGGFLDEMFASVQSHPTPDLIGSMHPRYVDPTTGIEPRVFRAPDGGPITSMTSGALMPAWIFDRIGMFVTEYFIDQVDIEYCFRIRAAGYVVADSQTAVLLHAAGFPRRICFLNFSFEPTNQSSLRRYYLSRNRVAVYRKYFGKFPGMVSQSIYYAFRETVKCLIAERERPRKLRNMVLGTWDGFTGRMGKREGL